MPSFDAISIHPFSDSGSAEAATASVTQWKVWIDWDDDKALAGYDDISDYWKQMEWDLGFRAPERFAADENRCRITLKNADKRFSPENTGGTYYGKLVPHKFMRIQSIHPTHGTVTHWTGWIDTILPTWNERGELIATIEGCGPKRYYEDKRVSMTLMQDVTADQAVEAIILQAGAPPALDSDLRLDTPGHAELDSNAILPDLTQRYVLDEGLTTFPYVGDTWDDTAAYPAIAQLAEAERGRFFFDRLGRAIFWGRDYLQQITTAGGTLSPYQRADYVYGQDIINQVIVRNYPRLIEENATLWTLSEPVTVSANNDKDITARYTESNSDVKVGGHEVVIPSVGAATLHYTPVDAGLQITLVEQAASTKITLTNSSGDDVTVDTLVLKGTKLTAYQVEEYKAEDLTSIALYGKREYKLDNKLMADGDYANDLANFLLHIKANPRGYLKTVGIRVRDDDTETMAITWEIGDRIYISEAQTVHADDYFILGEQHRVAEGGLHDVTFTLERAATHRVLLLDTVGLAELDENAYLGL